MKTVAFYRALFNRVPNAIILRVFERWNAGQVRLNSPDYCLCSWAIHDMIESVLGREVGVAERATNALHNLLRKKGFEITQRPFDGAGHHLILDPDLAHGLFGGGAHSWGILYDQAATRMPDSRLVVQAFEARVEAARKASAPRLRRQRRGAKE